MRDNHLHLKAVVKRNPLSVKKRYNADAWVVITQLCCFETGMRKPMVHNSERLNIKSSSFQGNAGDSTELCLLQSRIAEQTKSLNSLSCFLPGSADAIAGQCHAQNKVRGRRLCDLDFSSDEIKFTLLKESNSKSKPNTSDNNAPIRKYCDFDGPSASATETATWDKFSKAQSVLAIVDTGLKRK